MVFIFTEEFAETSPKSDKKNQNCNKKGYGLEIYIIVISETLLF